MKKLIKKFINSLSFNEEDEKVYVYDSRLYWVKTSDGWNFYTPDGKRLDEKGVR